MLFRSWSQIVEAFLSGTGDTWLHLLSPITVWARYGSKAPAKVVAWNHTSGSGLSVGPDIQSVKDLGGKTWPFPSGIRSTMWCLQALLKENGLTPSPRRQARRLPMR